MGCVQQSHKNNANSLLEKNKKINESNIAEIESLVHKLYVAYSLYLAHPQTPSELIRKMGPQMYI